jgi:hypothetical protein
MDLIKDIPTPPKNAEIFNLASFFKDELSSEVHNWLRGKYFENKYLEIED